MSAQDRFTLTGFGDEISPELTEQLDVLAAEGIRHLELRGIWGKNVLDLADEEVTRARDILDARGFAVSAIASPIGKVPLDADFDSHLARFEIALERARRFGARYIRVFSFYPPEAGGTMEGAEVVRGLSILASRAEEEGIILLLENDEELYGALPERALEIVEGVGSPALRLAFDPANFVRCGVRPFDRAWPLLAGHVEYVHIKDARTSDGSIRLAGQGDGQLPELLADLRARGYEGFLSLEPHLSVAGKASGFSGPALFTDAIRALKSLLAAL